MDKMRNRVRQLLWKLEYGYTNLNIRSASWGYSVTYKDILGHPQQIDIYEITGRRKSYVVRWVSNGNLKLRLPAYDKRFLR